MAITRTGQLLLAGVAAGFATAGGVRAPGKSQFDAGIVNQFNHNYRPTLYGTSAPPTSGSYEAGTLYIQHAA